MPSQPPNRSGSLLTGVMLGVPLMAAVDTIVFHQLLGWHHFYDRSTPAVGLVSDGLLQSAYLVMLIAGFFRYADLRRWRTVAVRSIWAGFFLGLGAFQLVDGLVNHKVLRVHQIRYGVDDLFRYDLAWNLSGAILVVVGTALAWWSRSEVDGAATNGASTP